MEIKSGSLKAIKRPSGWKIYNRRGWAIGYMIDGNFCQTLIGYEVSMYDLDYIIEKIKSAEQCTG